MQASSFSRGIPIGLGSASSNALSLAGVSSLVVASTSAAFCCASLAASSLSRCCCNCALLPFTLACVGVLVVFMVVDVVLGGSGSGGGVVVVVVVGVVVVVVVVVVSSPAFFLGQDSPTTTGFFVSMASFNHALRRANTSSGRSFIRRMRKTFESLGFSFSSVFAAFLSIDGSTKFCVTAMEVSRFITTWYHPAGTNIISPGFWITSMLVTFG
mmetsp:Transcript_1229/g.2073  ORF Transcript_1229/g.2073 Transcript_1229/m.2073 type:complete len:213 (-) Transcript_1229:1124-1762(-)